MKTKSQPQHTNEVSHTPTPWKTTYSHDIVGNGLPLFNSVGLREDEANAAFIVKAANCHEDLIKALGYYATGCTDQGKWAKNAIAKAEGK